MVKTTKPLLTLTAADLMSRDVVAVPKQMSLRAAAGMLSQARISGAPVVDEFGRCIGVLSAGDFVQRALNERPRPALVVPAGPCACADWQVFEAETLPADDVGTYMTADPVTTAPSTGIAELARMMIDAHIHRVIVVDAEGRPIGVISSTDILAAVAQAERPQ
jgi:CBS-domain-containing membrane protein